MSRTVSVGPIFVGDLWVLAGQSNMEGRRRPDRRHAAESEGHRRWGWTASGRRPRSRCTGWSTRPTRSIRATRRPASRAAAEQHKTRTKGAGLGLPFAVAMVEATGVPVGLVACAHGGTSMAQWDPAKKGEGGKSLYGSMLRQVKLAGGKVKGVLWYQGESDAIARAAEGLPEGLRRLHRRRPRRLRPARPAVLLRPDRPVRHAAATPRAGTPCRRPSGGSPSGCRTRPSSRSIDLELDDADPRRHARA